MVQWWNKRSLAVGKPTTGPKQAFTGDHVYATNLDSPYENQTDAHLSMPMIAVPESGSSFYNFNTGMTLKQIMTMCIFMCSLRGRCCQVAAYTGKTSGWTKGEVDLSAYKGQNVRVIFQLRTDGSVTKDGFI